MKVHGAEEKHQTCRKKRQNNFMSEKNRIVGKMSCDCPRLTGPLSHVTTMKDFLQEKTDSRWFVNKNLGLSNTDDTGWRLVSNVCRPIISEWCKGAMEGLHVLLSYYPYTVFGFGWLGSASLPAIFQRHDTE